MNKKLLLENLRQKEQQSDLPLKDTATNLVFGEGNPDADILFLGEAPGRFEDEKGLPFIGQAGKILDKLLESIGLKREEVFITSVLHYRPPKNRDPKPEEIAAFGPFIDELIKIIDPKVIVTLDRFSLNKFLPDKKIGEVHGKPQKINWNNKKITVIPMYHPASALYRREIIKALEEDFQEIRKTSN